MFALSLGILENMPRFFSSLLNKLSDTTMEEHQCHFPNIAQIVQCCVATEVAPAYSFCALRRLHQQIKVMSQPRCGRDAFRVCSKDPQSDELQTQL